ncbi:unnamed protein product [Prunus brigantina]
MTGLPPSSYPSQVPLPAVVISPENRREKLGFARNFAGFILRRPAAIFGNQGGNFGECSIYRGGSAEISAEGLVALLLFEKGGYSLMSGPDIGVMSGFPQDSSRVPGNSWRVLSIELTKFN